VRADARGLLRDERSNTMEPTTAPVVRPVNKQRKSSLPRLLNKASQTMKLAEQAASREEADSDKKMERLRGVLNMAIDAERQLKRSKAIDEPGVREFLIECKFRV
jgi:hypothetical protein